MPPEEETPLESLQRRIYQQPTQTGAPVSPYTDKEPAKTYGWQAPPPIVVKKQMPWAVKFLIGAGLFLFIAGIVAAFLVFRGTRAISNERVIIDVPPSIGVASGDTVPLLITIKNTNPVRLQDAQLSVTFPPGTLDENGAPLPSYVETLGTVDAGAEELRSVQVRLFGTEGQTLTIPIQVTFNTEGSQADFVSKKEHAITIATSPVSVQVQALSQSPSGQSLTLTVTVRSNASAPLENVAVLAQYPTGFSVRSTDPAATSANLFTLGTLAPSDQKTIKVTGILIGQNAEQRAFRFTAGIPNADGTSTLSNSYAEGSAVVAISKPFLNVDLSLNRETADTIVAAPGSIVSSLLSWQNTLPDTLANATIRVAISGAALAPGTISGGTGFYNSSDNTVVFSSDTNPGLASLASGDRGNGSFTFGLKSAQELAGVTNPTVTLSVSVTGQQGTQGTTPQSLSSTLTRTVRVGTAVSASSELSRGTGPVPPVVGSETTYSITLKAANTVNSVGGARMSLQLPSYVRYIGQSDVGITYNPDTRTVTWVVGDIQPGGTPSARFQVGFTPSASQQGISPTLAGEGTFTAVDRATGAQVIATTPALTSDLPGSRGSGTVK